MDRSDLITLAERLEAAKEGSRELDAEIARALDNADACVCNGNYTTSRDAIAALTEELLPGWRYLLCVDDEGAAFTLGYFDGVKGTLVAGGKGKVEGRDAECRSRCAALLRALAEKRKQTMVEGEAL